MVYIYSKFFSENKTVLQEPGGSQIFLPFTKEPRKQNMSTILEVFEYCVSGLSLVRA